MATVKGPKSDVQKISNQQASEGVLVLGLVSGRAPSGHATQGCVGLYLGEKLSSSFGVLADL